jgi:hypothetical protein
MKLPRQRKVPERGEAEVGAENERLRAIALERLGAHAPELSREALETGRLRLIEGVLSWQGSFGDVRAHRVVLELDPALCDLVRASPFALDALTAAIAGAIGSTREALAELVVVPRTIDATNSPYRG